MATMSPNARVSNRMQRNGQRCHWTPDEDFRLALCVHQFGAGNWDRIARSVGGRSGKSCRVRWLNQLNPEINKLPFSEEEHEMLFKLHEKYGNKWSTIASFMPGRTDNQVKNRFHVLQRRRSMNASAAPSSNANPPDSPNQEGPIDLSGFGGFSTVPHGSQFPENHYSGFVPCFSAMADSIPVAPLPMTGGIKMTPSFRGGSSSTYAVGESSAMARSTSPGWVYPGAVDNASLDYMIPRHVTSANSMIPTGNPAASPNISPVVPPEQGVGVVERQFINFLGDNVPE